MDVFCSFLCLFCILCFCCCFFSTGHLFSQLHFLCVTFFGHFYDNTRSTALSLEMFLYRCDALETLYKTLSIKQLNNYHYYYHYSRFQNSHIKRKFFFLSDLQHFRSSLKIDPLLTTVKGGKRSWNWCKSYITPSIIIEIIRNYWQYLQGLWPFSSITPAQRRFIFLICQLRASIR